MDPTVSSPSSLSPQGFPWRHAAVAELPRMLPAPPSLSCWISGAPMPCSLPLLSLPIPPGNPNPSPFPPWTPTGCCSNRRQLRPPEPTHTPPGAPPLPPLPPRQVNRAGSPSIAVAAASSPTRVAAVDHHCDAAGHPRASPSVLSHLG